MAWKRIYAVFLARTREFYRDRPGLGWNIAMPFLLVFGFALIFSGEPGALFKIGLLGEPGKASPIQHLQHIRTIHYADESKAVQKVDRHQVDLLLDLRSDTPRYWVNTHSQKGYFAEKLMLDAYRQSGSALPDRQAVEGRALRYVDWVLPGILAMNMMFSCFWGVGWVIVRYRKNGVLRRLHATPLSALEFLSAQILSRMLVVMGATAIVYLGADLFLDFRMNGSFVTLFAVFVAGALCLVSMGLIIASRLKTEELADGLLSTLSWPMILLAGVWYSMEGTSHIAQVLSQLVPLTYLVEAARAVMIDGAGLIEVLPQIGLLTAIGLALLGIAAWLFRWD